MPQPTRTQAIKAHLEAKTWPDLAGMYNHDMEVQVNVAQDGGERVEGEFRGKQWLAWTDHLTTWKSFRIPYKANTEPEYEDKPMTFDLSKHVEGIGMTGWDWKNRCSRWFAYDFDALTGHSERHAKKLTDTELGDIREVVKSVPWVTLRTSTSGKGLHLYVYLNSPFNTANHHEHAAVARAILAMLTATTTFDFNRKVDICGSNMWVWHRKMYDRDTGERVGLQVVKTGEPLQTVPPNWKDHLNVVRGKSMKTRPAFVGTNLPTGDASGDITEDTFNELTGQRAKVELDAEHKAVIDYLAKSGAFWWFDPDHWMLVTHTYHLKQAHNILNLRGHFDTLATGTERGTDHNCFAYPLPRGAWAIRRYSPGTKESDTWEQDGSGWTKCFLNRELDFGSACRVSGGTEHPKGGQHFDSVDRMLKALTQLGVTIDVNNAYKDRTGLLKPHKEDGKVVVSIPATKEDQGHGMDGWIKSPKEWTRVVRINQPPKLEGESNLAFDDMIRHLINPDGVDCGWVIKAEGKWNEEPLVHVRAALDCMDYSKDDKVALIGENIFKPWRLINQPFQAEYPGDRTWNRFAAQLRFSPAAEPGDHKHWDMILDHCGTSLDAACRENPWCRANGIVKGCEYLRCWIASLIKEPGQPLPYLFFYSGEQNTGKSTFHEAIEILLTRGCMRADTALTSSGGFNGEFANSVLCVVEETDLRISKLAYARIKDWVTSRQISIHVKGATPYMIPNTTHWIQCANEPTACPVFPGDTRITMVQVPPLPPEKMIPKKELEKILEKEAPDFLASLLKLELPPSNDRLNIPILVTAEKLEAQNANKTELQTFVEEKCYNIPGHRISFSDFYEKFKETLPGNEVSKWSKKRVSMEIPSIFPKGKCTDDPNAYIGNITFDFAAEPGRPYYRDGIMIRNEK
jgi:hypothetical protein